MTTTAKSTKNGKTTTSAPFDAFTFPTPTFEVPAAFRDFAEKSASQARDAYARMKTATEDATGLVEDTFETAREGAFAIGVKALDAAKTNTDASFALFRDMFGVKTFSDAIELQSTFARKQFEAVTSQVKELQQLGEKFITDTTKPVTEQVEKTFKELKVA
jgi:phasin